MSSFFEHHEGIAYKASGILFTSPDSPITIQITNDTVLYNISVRNYPLYTEQRTFFHLDLQKVEVDYLQQKYDCEEQ